ncbi:MAG: hypothetical protein GY750_10645 [Lentisphaerae bacterium]|nr:hypothetical protein [Lentisphaerota bacterium]MCP4101869.1 hypothetical protein [Lentisphaerota bacterium]
MVFRTVYACQKDDEPKLSTWMSAYTKDFKPERQRTTGEIIALRYVDEVAEDVKKIIQTLLQGYYTAIYRIQRR